jgi:hypothetical protein
MSTDALMAAEYHRGAKEAYQRVADEWPSSLQKAQTWANNCAVSEQQHREAALTAPASETQKLLAALEKLVEACLLADQHEELSDYIDGSLIDEARAALKADRQGITK